MTATEAPADPRLAKLHVDPSSIASASTQTIAQAVDSFAVYEEAVQTPAIECTNLDSLYYNAQEIGSRRPNARILREDFSSTSAVAVHWLTMNHEHRSQAVDIDLDALKIARKRLLRQRHPLGEKWSCKLLQHAEYNAEGNTSRWLEEEKQEEGEDDGRAPASASAAEANGSDAPDEDEEIVDSWSKGAASDRFERKFQAKQAKLRMKHQRQRAKDKAKSSKKFARSFNNLDDDGDNHDENGEDDGESPHLMLMHSSVLSLPVPAPPKAPRHGKAPAPDIVASLNYALSYFHKRSDLVAYLTSVQQSLRRGTGVLISDQFAGPISEAAREHYGQGRELTAEEELGEQEELWSKFVHEPGFLRRGESANQMPTRLDNRAGVQLWKPEPRLGEGHEQVHSQDGADAAVWPRGRLSLVRTGKVPLKQKGSPTRNVEFEYWREDAPTDLRTNTFRMSLSFRFTEDGSWIRDYFSYNFRFWTMAEVIEAMEEAGFAEISVQVIDRGAGDHEEGDAQEQANASGVADSDSDSDSSSDDARDDEDDDEGPYAGMSFFKESLKEKPKPSSASYRRIEEDEKVFARRSFGSECGQKKSNFVAMKKLTLQLPSSSQLTLWLGPRTSSGCVRKSVAPCPPTISLFNLFASIEHRGGFASCNVFVLVATRLHIVVHIRGASHMSRRAGDAKSITTYAREGRQRKLGLFLVSTLRSLTTLLHLLCSLVVDAETLDALDEGFVFSLTRRCRPLCFRFGLVSCLCIRRLDWLRRRGISFGHCTALGHGHFVSETRVDLFDLSLLDRRFFLGVRQSVDFAPLFVGLESLLNRSENGNESLGDGLFQIGRVDVARDECVLESLVGVKEAESAAELFWLGNRKDGTLWSLQWHQRCGEAWRVLLARFGSLVLQAHNGDQDGLGKGQDTIAVCWRGFGFTHCRLDLGANLRFRVEKVDLGGVVRCRHLGALQTRNHGVHQVSALLVAQLRQQRFCEGENLALIHAAELKVHIEVLLIEGLQARVQHRGKQGRSHLLDDFCSCLFGVVLARQSSSTVHVHRVSFCQLIFRSNNENQSLRWHADGAEHGNQDVLVELHTVLDELNGRLEVIEKGVDVGQQDLDHDARSQEVCDLDKRGKVADVRPRRRCSAPVGAHRPRRSGLEDRLDGVTAENLMEVSGDQGERLRWRQLGSRIERRHD